MVFLPPDEAPGMMAPLLLEHMTPELIRRPDWLEHSNRARRIQAMTAVVRDLEQARAAYTRLFGAGAITTEGESLVVAVGRGGELRLTTSAHARMLHGGLVPERECASEYLVGMVIEVDDLDETRRCLDANGVPSRAEGTTVRIGAAEACGAVLEFSARQ